MNLRRNVIANYSSQLYITSVGILMVPLYIKYMGPEAYGLVGFFAMLQALFNFLDIGLTPTIVRESARFHSGVISVIDYRRLTRAIESIFAVIAMLGGILLYMLAQPIASHWLKFNQLPKDDIVIALQIMAIVVALRWMCGLYRGVITGAERLVWLSGFNSMVATSRFVLVVPILMFISATPQIFFTFQLIVASLEFVGLALMAYRILPVAPIVPAEVQIRFEWAPLKPLLRFSLSIAFSSSVWMLVTQTDKLILSNILPLADYGYFTVAVLVASGIMLITVPISSAIMPRMVQLEAQGKKEDLIGVYRQATQLVTVTAMPVALVLIFLSPQVLWAWTGDSNLVQRAAPVLSIYAIGYSFLAVGAFPYYLQYASGNLRLHLIGNCLFVLFLIPIIIYAARYHGMIGAGWAWLIANFVYFILWTPLVHNKFVPGLHMKWLAVDIIRPIVLPLIAAVVVSNCINWDHRRLELTLELFLTLCIFLLLAYPLANRIQNLYKRNQFCKIKR